MRRNAARVLAAVLAAPAPPPGACLKIPLPCCLLLQHARSGMINTCKECGRWLVKLLGVEVRT